MRGGYSYATADESHAFHMISMAFVADECIGIHGYYLREGRFDGCTAFGEDHDNWTAAGARHFFRRNGRA